jgi:hypothetical protein
MAPIYKFLLLTIISEISYTIYIGSENMRGNIW